MYLCYAAVFLMAVLQSAAAQSLISLNSLFYRSPSFQTLSATELDAWMESLSNSQALKQDVIHVAEPLPRTLLPRNMASIAFAWADTGPASAWILTIDVHGEKIASALLDRPWWVPDTQIWEILKQQASNELCHVAISGIGGWNGRKIVSRGRTSFLFSTETLDARLMFMRKPLPFLAAKKNPGQTGLFAGDVSSYEKPKSIIQGFTVCTNCHAYSRNGSTMTLDMDYTGDKGGFAVLDIQPRMMLGTESIYSWNDMPAIKPAAYSMGLFARISPNGRYLAGTVNETSVFVMMNDIQFSQLFFPATGHIAIFDRQASKPFLLPGADHPDRVQTSPAWSPDGHTIAFAGTRMQPDLVDQVVAGKLKQESATRTIEELNKKYPVQFDIYTLAFNDGCGGQAVPLEGASQNGLSNYFPRYSPDCFHPEPYRTGSPAAKPAVHCSGQGGNSKGAGRQSGDHEFLAYLVSGFPVDGVHLQSQFTLYGVIFNPY